jgi:hypothetical protein
MAKLRADFRLDSDLLRWVGEYAEERGWSRTLVVEEALRSFRGDARGGVPDAPLEEVSGGSEPYVPAPPRAAAPAARRVVPERKFCPWGCGRVFKAGKSYCDGCGRDYETGEDTFAEFRSKGGRR